MTQLQRRLIATWLAALAFVAFITVAYDWPHIWWFTAGLAMLAVFVERPLLERIYSVAPTPAEFFSSRPLWKRFLVCYGVVLAIVAFSLLTFAQGIARYLGDNPVVLFVTILSPMLWPVVAHQLIVYKALADDDDA